MNFGNEALFFFSALGVFNGFVFGIYFLFLTRKKKISNYFLGALLLALSVRIGKSVLYYFNPSLLQVYLQIGLSGCWFIGPLLFFFIKSEKDQLKKVPQKWIWILLSLVVVIVAVGLVFPYQQYPQIWNRYVIRTIYLQWGIFMVLSGIELSGVIKKTRKPAQLKPFEIWPLVIFVVNLVIFSCYLLAIFQHWKGVYISGAVSFSLLLYVVILLLLYRRKSDNAQTPYAGRKLSEEDAQLLLKRLERAMLEKNVFKNPNLKLNDLAAEINVSAHQLSQLLNDNLGKGFTLFVNEYRIEEACKMLSTTKNLTIEAISDEVGFNSKSTFFTTFKKLKGMTPAMYQQRLKTTEVPTNG